MVPSLTESEKGRLFSERKAFHKQVTVVTKVLYDGALGFLKKKHKSCTFPARHDKNTQPRRVPAQQRQTDPWRNTGCPHRRPLSSASPSRVCAPALGRFPPPWHDRELQIPDVRANSPAREVEPVPASPQPQHTFGPLLTDCGMKECAPCLEAPSIIGSLSSSEFSKSPK